MAAIRPFPQKSTKRKAAPPAKSTKIKGSDIKAGMIIEIYDGRFQVHKVTKNASGGVFLSNGVKWRGVSANETVTLIGHFNP